MERGEMVGVKTLRDSGSGSGSGSGYGDGDGDGYGYGYGYGDGYGDGSGYGSGFGFGSDSGSGYGFGSGDGSGEYWRSVMPTLIAHWTDEQRNAFHRYLETKMPLAFWRSDAHGKPANGGVLNEVAAPGIIHREQGPLYLCEAGTLHATLNPPKWKGDRLWIVALHGDVIGDEEKFGCLEREILGEVLAEHDA